MNIVTVSEELRTKIALLDELCEQQSVTKQKILVLEKDILLLEKKLKKLKSSGNPVTDHCIVRYMQRVLGMENIINTIVTELGECYSNYISSGFNIDGKFPEKMRGESRYRIVVKNGKIVTIEN